MADAYLANQVVVTTSGVEKSVTYEAGSLLTDLDVQSAVEAAGGILLPATEAVVAMANRVRSQIDFTPELASTMMLAAATGTTSAFVSNNALSEVTWYIDARAEGTGNDLNSGLSPDSPLKTPKALQDRFGAWSTITPAQVGDFVSATINLLDSDDENPPTFSYLNLVGGIVGALVFRGTAKVLATGTFSNVVNKDRGTTPGSSVPNKVENTSASTDDYWTQYVGKILRVTSGDSSGAFATIEADLGTKIAKVCSWSDGNLNGFPSLAADGIVPPIAPPTTGDSFEIVDFPKVKMGANLLPSGEDVGFLVYEQLHFVGNTFGNIPIPQRFGADSPGFNMCIFDAPEVDVVGARVGFGGCAFYGLLNAAQGANINVAGGSFNSTILGDPPPYPGGIQVGRGCRLQSGNDPSFNGNGFDAACDVLVEGQARLGPLSFWNSGHTLVPFSGSNIIFEQFEPFFGEATYVPIWGNGNSGVQFSYENSSVRIDQIAFGGGTCPVPSVEVNLGENVSEGTQMILGYGGGSAIANQNGNAWDYATSKYIDPAVQLAWANFDIAVPSGFQEVSESRFGGTVTVGSASNPASGARITRTTFVLP